MSTTPTQPPKPPSTSNSRGPSSSRPSTSRSREASTHPLADQIPVTDPDAVQKGIIDVWGWVEDNAKWLAAVVVLFVIAGLAHVIVHAYWDRQERKAQDAYFAAESKYTKIRDGFDKAKLKALMPAQAPTKPGEPEPVAASGDLAKDYGAVVADLEKVANERKGTVAGAQAAILASQTYLDYKQADKAASLSEQAVKSIANDTLVGQLARVQWGSALASKGDCAGAVKIWQDVLDNKNVTYLHSEASLRSGLCYETLNQNDKAAEMYRRVTADGPESAASSTAKGLLRALEVRTQSAPATAAPAAKG